METRDVNGHAMPVDERNRVKLTDLWIMAGRPQNRKPAIFKRLKRVRCLLSCADWLATRGRHAATWAHYVLARDYAAYLGLEPPPQPPPSAANQDWAEIHQMLDDLKQARQQAAAERAAHEAERAAESGPDSEQAWVFDGEEWQGAYEPDTAGEEWKGAAADNPAGAVGPTDRFRTDDGYGPDDLFFDLINIPGSFKIRASVN